MAISGHQSEASLRTDIGRPSSELRACSDVLSDALSGRPRQSLQTEFRGAVIPSNLHVPASYFIKYENPLIGRKFKFATAWIEFSNI